MSLVVIKKTWIFLCLVVLLGGCGGPQVVRETSQPAKPTWMTQLPQEDEYLYFVGSFTGAGSLERGRSAARKDAQAKIAEYLGVDVASQLEMTITDIEQSVKEELQTKTDAMVKQAIMEDSYHEKMIRSAENSRMVTFDVHLLLKYPKVQAEKELGRKESEAQQNALAAYDLYQAGQSHQMQGKHRQARRFFRDALNLLDDHSMVIPLQQGDIQSSSELVSRLKSEEQKAISNLRRVVLWTWETNPSGNQPSANMSSHIQLVLQQHDFSVVEYPAPLLNETSGLLDGAKWPNKQDIFQALKAKEASYLIVAQAKAEFSSTKMRNHFYKSQGVLKVFNMQNDEIILTLPINSTGYARNKEQAGLIALDEAGKVVGELLAKELLSREDQ